MRALALVLVGLGLVFVGCKKQQAVVDNININLALNLGTVAQHYPIETNKNIDTEQGNPYGAFSGDIQAAMGNDPAIISLDSASITLQGDAAHAVFEDIFTSTFTL